MASQHRSRLARHLYARLPAVILLCLAAVSANAQLGPEIAHSELKCVLAGEYLVLQAKIEPAGSVTTAKAYFRAADYEQFYYVEMVLADDLFQGVLPKPSPEIAGIHYYLEAMDSSFNSVRTAEFTPQVVVDELTCEEKNPVPPVYVNQGAITIGSTAAGPALPSGFLSEGVVGTISSLGRATTGGSSGLLIGGIAAAGAGVGLGLVAAGGSEDPTPDVVNSPPATGGNPPDNMNPPPTTTPTTPTTVELSACFETSPTPARILEGQSVRFDASCTGPNRESIATYAWDFGDDRGGRDGRVVNRQYGRPGTYTAELTVTAATGQTDSVAMDVIVDEIPSAPTGGGGGGGGGGGPGPPTTADIQVTGASSGAPVTHIYTIRNNGPLPASGISFSASFVSGSFSPGAMGSFSGFQSCSFPAGAASCSAPTMAVGAVFTVTIHATPTASPTVIMSTGSVSSSSPPDTVSNNTASASTSAQQTPSEAGQRTVLRMRSQLELPPGDGSTRSHLMFNDQKSAVTDNSGPSTHEIPSRDGDNVVEGRIEGNPEAQGVWRFDFMGAEGLEPGSFVVDRGNVISRSSNAIVFRIAPGQRRIRFHFQVKK